MAKRSVLSLLVVFWLPLAHSFVARTPLLIRHGSTIPKSKPNPLLAVVEEPSNDEIDFVISEVSGYTGGDIIRPIRPERRWLWRRWSGTVLREVLPSVAFNMVASLFVVVAIRKATGGSWAVGVKPDASHPIIARLALFDSAWKYLKTLTSFTLTFYVAESFSLWKDIYNIGRKIQGRLNDISLLCATHAKRDDQNKYTSEAQDVLNKVGGFIRVFHALMWAGCARHFKVLSTKRGLQRMVQKGLLTQEEADTLNQLDLPRTQLHNAVLEWTMITIQNAMQRGVIVGGTGLELMFLEKFCTLRGTYATIGDRLDGRMPLAYAHMVQILVDCFLFFAPLALYAELGAFSVVSVGLLTFFFSGLLDLAKVFLDPLDNEDYCQGSVKICLGVLMRESNAGSVRWKNGAETLPF